VVGGQCYVIPGGSFKCRILRPSRDWTKEFSRLQGSVTNADIDLFGTKSLPIIWLVYCRSGPTIISWLPKDYAFIDGLELYCRRLGSFDFGAAR
jgi:hypothetical protein